MKKLFIMMAAVAVCFGCKTEDTPGNPYDGPDYVYLTNVTGLNNYFSWNGSADLTQSFTVMTVGSLNYDRDREVEIEITSDVADLPVGDLITVAPAVIPQGETEMRITVTFHNNPEYFLNHKGTNNPVTFTIKENDDFKVWPITESTTLHEVNFVIQVSSSYY